MSTIKKAAEALESGTPEDKGAPFQVPVNTGSPEQAADLINASRLGKAASANIDAAKKEGYDVPVVTGAHEKVLADRVKLEFTGEYREFRGRSCPVMRTYERRKDGAIIDVIEFKRQIRGVKGGPAPAPVTMYRKLRRPGTGVVANKQTSSVHRELTPEAAALLQGL